MSKKYLLDIYPLMSALVKHQDLLKDNRNLLDVTKEWFECMVRKRMYWQETDDLSPGETLVTLFGYTDASFDDGDLSPAEEELFDFGDSELIERFDQMLRPILPGETWNIVHLRFDIGTNVRVEIGDDFRIVEWRRTHKHQLMRAGLWKASRIH